MAKDSKPPVESRGPSRAEARFNVTLSVVSLLAIVLMVNYVAMRNPRIFSLSDEHFQRLSPVTTQVLGTITNDVDIILFFDGKSPLFSYAETLLRQYRDANAHIRLETVDYNVRPTRAEEIKKQFRLGPNVKDAVLFTNGRDQKIVRQAQLSQYDADDLIAGRSKSVKRKGFNGEAHFTSALLAVSRVKHHDVAYITGFGDYHSPTNVSATVGYTAFTELLRKHNAKVGAIHLPNVKEIPSYVKVIILPGFENNVPDLEQAKLDRYLEAGGRMLVMFRFDTDTGLERMLYRWGVKVEKKLTIDTLQKNAAGLYLLPDEMGSHPIVRPLRQKGSPVGMSTPRPVWSMAANQAADAPQVEELLRTSTQGLAVSDYKNRRYDKRHDDHGRIPVAAAIEKGGIQGVTEGSTRIVVLGDSMCFANNNLMQAGNWDFAWNIMSWLMDQSELLGIAPQPVTEYQFSLTKRQSTSLRWIFLGGIPCGILFFGWIVWLRRQN